MMNTKTKSKSRKKKKSIVPYHRKPDHMGLDEWQIALRRQFAANNKFGINNIGTHPVYSDFSVYNPATGNTYKVAIRSNPKEIKNGINYNFCSCFDFKTSGFYTCKHIEAVMLHLNKKRPLKKHFNYEYEQPYSSVHLRFTPEGRKVMVRLNSSESEKFQQLISNNFSENGEILESSYDQGLALSEVYSTGVRYPLGGKGLKPWLRTIVTFIPRPKGLGYRAW